MIRNCALYAFAAAVLPLLSACGADSGGSITSAPPPTPPPPPPPPPLSSPVEILKSPATQDFATFAIGGSVQIRFDAAAGTYEMALPGRTWDTLIDDPQSEPGQFLFASAPIFNAGSASVATRFNHPEPERRYNYASFGRWYVDPASDPGTGEGIFAFAVPTPTGGVATTGSAEYSGLITGTADFGADGGGWGIYYPAPIEGDVSLRFDFAAGTLTGRMRPFIACDCQQIDIPVQNFTQTIFGVGSQTFSGRFDTPLAGANSFSGLFAGPDAQELIGQWTFPLMVGANPHSATGVWIAKQK